MSQPCVSSPPSWQTRDRFVEEDETVGSVEQSEKEPLTAAEIVKTSGYETLCRKDSGIGGANVLNQQTMPTTPTDDYSLPDCDLVFQNANWMPGDMTRSSAPNSPKVTLVSKENLPSSGWMAQIDASDEIKQKREEANKTRLSSAFKTTFLRIPSQYERRSMTREGTPSAMSTCTTKMNVAVVPDVLAKRWRKRGNDSFLAVISALYAKFLIVMGLAFPMTEVISNHVTSSSYLGFYLYLYFGCIAYFLYVFITMLRNKSAKNRNICKNW